MSGRFAGQRWFFKCLTTAETPALHYFCYWSSTKILSGEQSSAGLIPSFSVDSSSHRSGTSQDHTGTPVRKRWKSEGRRAFLHEIIPECWLEDQNRRRLLPIRWGGGAGRFPRPNGQVLKTHLFSP